MSNNKAVSKFESIGAYIPNKIVSTKEMMDKLENKSTLDLERITGIKNRRVRSEIESSLSIATAAARDCLKNSKYRAEDLDIIINTSITRFKEAYIFFLDPPLSLLIKQSLKAKNAINFDVSNACAGMMTGACILDNMIKAGIVKNGMVVSGECITPITETAIKEIKEKVDPQFASLTVGDAGAAFILDKTEDSEIGIDYIDILTFAKHADLCYGMPSDENPGCAMYTDAAKIHGAALTKIPVYLEKVWEKNGAVMEDYDVAIPHQTAVRAIKMGIEEIRKYFEKTPEEIPEVLVSVDQYGNTSSTAVIIALYNALKKNRIKEGSKVIFLALASGLVLGFISARLGKLEVNGKVN